MIEDCQVINVGHSVIKAMEAWHQHSRDLDSCKGREVKGERGLVAEGGRET